MKFIENIQLNNYFKLPCRASRIIFIENEDEFISLNEFTSNAIVIGEASNLIVADCINKDIIKFDYKKIHHENNYLSISGAVTWSEVIEYTLKNHLYGLENLTAIPGLATAAPVQNIGAYGVQISDFIDSITCWDLKSEQFKVLTNKECVFDYRKSLFQTNKSLIIHKVLLKLNDSFNPVLTYKSIQDYFLQNNIQTSNITPSKLSEVVRTIRYQRLPDPFVHPNVGSFFKNPSLSSSQFFDLKSNFSDIPFWKERDAIKISAGWLISSIKNSLLSNSIEIFETNNLVLINRGTSFTQLLEFSDNIISLVFEKFGIKLTIEPEIIS